MRRLWKICFWGWVIVVWGGVVAFAETETFELKNGDRVTGEVLSRSEEAVVVKTNFMGTVTIAAQALKPKKSALPKTAAVPWKRTVSLGYVQTGGNTEKSQGNVNLKASRLTDHDEWTLALDAYYSSSDNKNDARKFYGLGRYAYSFGSRKKWYHFLKIEGDHDRFANVDYRLTPSTGLGYWFSDTAEGKAMVETAVGFEHTRYRDGSGQDDDVVLVPRGLWEKKLNERTSVSQEIVLYPSFTDGSRLRVRAQSQARSQISDQISVTLKFIDEWNSHPSGRAEKNDYRITSGLEYAF